MGVEKNLYMEHPAVRALTRREVREWRLEKRVRVGPSQHDDDDSDCPKPVRTWLEAAFPELITAELEASGFPEPTVIQSQAWPVALSGRDMVGLASTGSGKTLCFALPAIVHVIAQRILEPGDGPIALMLAPTRELALQIKGECDRFGSSSGVKNTAVYGGVPKGPQQRDLQHGVEMAIATPGRLLDMIDCGATNLKRTTFLVLDEADRMLDLGFEPQLRQIIQLTPPPHDRQTLMWSATWPREVRRLAESFLRRPLFVQVNEAASLRVNESIEQRFEVCTDERDRAYKFFLSLPHLNVGDGSAKLIIFCNKGQGCDRLKGELKNRGIAAESLHGGKSQQERDWVMQQFRSGAVTTLLATDVAARGLDVKDVGVVINYEAPSQAEDYVHRVGRAGRGGAKGLALSFLTPANAPVARELVAMLRKSRQPCPPALEWLARSGGGGDAYRRWAR